MNIKIIIGIILMAIPFTGLLYKLYKEDINLFIHILGTLLLIIGFVLLYIGVLNN